MLTTFVKTLKNIFYPISMSAIILKTAKKLVVYQFQTPRETATMVWNNAATASDVPNKYFVYLLGANIYNLFQYRVNIHYTQTTIVRRCILFTVMIIVLFQCSKHVKF